MARFQAMVIDGLGNLANALVIVKDILVVRAVERHARVHSVAPTAVAARGAIKSVAWDAIIVDVTLRDEDGVELLARARARGWGGLGLAIADHVTDDLVDRAFDARVSLTTTACAEARVLRFIQDGNARHERFALVTESWGLRYKLTTAELTNLELVARAMSNEQVAFHREISEETVKRQNKNLLKKTLDDNVMQAALRLWNEL